MAEITPLQVKFVSLLDPVMKLVMGIADLGVFSDDVPPPPDHLVVSSVVTPPGSSQYTVILLPSPELCQWIGTLSDHAAKRLAEAKPS